MEKRFGHKGRAVVEHNVGAITAGMEAVSTLKLAIPLPQPVPSTVKRWLISGNEATGLGAVRGGIRFVAAYPITPASEILEWLAPTLPKVGGALLQAEDELAVDQHDHRRLLRRHAGADGDLRSRPLADDRGDRARHRGRNPDRRHRRDARRPVDRHPDQVGAGRPQHRGLRHARRRAAYRARAADRVATACSPPNGRPIWPRRCRRRRSCCPTSSSARRRRRSSGRPTSPSSASVPRRPTSRALQALRARRQPRLADGDPGHARRPVHRRRPHPHRARHPDRQHHRSRLAARQAPRQARPVRLRRSLGDARRRGRDRGHHLGLAHRGGARGAGAGPRRRVEGAADRAAADRAGAAARDGGGARGRDQAARSSSRATAPSSTATCAPITPCRTRCASCTVPVRCRCAPAKSTASS